MSLIIQEVPLKYVNQVWSQIEGFISDAMVHAQGDYTAEDARVFSTSGSWSTIVAVDGDNRVHGAALVSYFNRPSSRVAFIMAIGGKLVVNKETWAQFEGILKSNGATSLEGAVRESVGRLWRRYGMTPKYTIVGKSL